MKKALASIAAASVLMAGAAPAFGQGTGGFCRPVASCDPPTVTTAPPPAVIDIPAPPAKKKKAKKKNAKGKKAGAPSSAGSNGAAPTFSISIF